MQDMLNFVFAHWVDFMVGTLILYYLLVGWRRGCILGLTDLAGMILSFLVALHYYAWFGIRLMDGLQTPKGVSFAGAFLLIGLVSQILFSFIVEYLYLRIYSRLAAYLDRHVYEIVLQVDTWLGCIPALIEAGIMSSVLLTILLVLPVSGVVKRAIVDSTSGAVLVLHAQGVERQLNDIFGDAVNETLTFLTVNADPGSEEEIQLGFTYTDGVPDATSERDMLALVNKERSERHLQPLIMDPALRDLARSYGNDLFSQGYFSHQNLEGKSPFDRMDAVGIRYGTAGENLALAPNVKLAHEGLMHSPGHRANILLPEYTRVGIGVIDGGIYGEMYVQEFTD